MSSFIGNIYLYLKKRFPAPIAFLYGLLFAASAVSFFDKSDWFFSLQATIIIAATMFLFLLRLRLFDEIKDYSYDSVHHPDRPLQQGIISLKVIKRLAAAVLLIEICLQLFVPIEAALIYAIFLGYSLLMFKEFFLKNFLSRNMLLMLFLHQMIFAILAIYAASVTTKTFFLPASGFQILFVFVLFIPPLLFELGRKFEHRRDAEGKLTDDTYVYRWGLNKTFLFIVSVIAAHIISLLIILQRSQPLLIVPYFLLLTAIVVLYFTHQQIVIRTAKIWSVLCAIFGLSIFLINNLFFQTGN